MSFTFSIEDIKRFTFQSWLKQKELAKATVLWYNLNV